jgi:hypothetical protein
MCDESICLVMNDDQTSFKMETSFGRKFVEQQKKLKYKENN